MNFKETLKVIALATVIAVCAVSCNEKKPKSLAQPLPKATISEQNTIRYIDEDSVMKNYILAQELTESMLRRQNQFDAAQQQRSNEINKFGNAMQQKYQNNQYLSQEAFNTDQAKLQKMQNDAQDYLGKMQQSIANEATQNQRQLSDSISNYLKVYAIEKGYDMILMKAATLYVDPKLEVTNEVVEGLNKRYVKVSTK